MKLSKLFKKPDTYYPLNLWQYKINPLTVTSQIGLTSQHKQNLISQAEEQYYLNNNTDWAEWIWTNVPMYIVQRPVSRIDILAQDGAVVLVSIIPTGSILRSHIKPLDPIVPVICGYDQLLQDEWYTGYMDDLVFEMQKWIEGYQNNNGTAYSDSSYMTNVKFYVKKIIERVNKATLLSLREQVVFKEWLLLFAGNPLASLQYALKQVE